MPPNHNDNQRGRGGGSPRRGRSYRGQNSNRAARGRPFAARGGGQPEGRYRRLEEIDFVVQMHPDATPPRQNGRGIGRGLYINNTPANSPRGRGSGSGRATPTGRGRGRGRGFIHNANTPLSKLLYLERPLLKPVIFVPAKHTPILFQKEEEIFQVSEQKQDLENDIPTAERVARVFSGQSLPFDHPSPPNENERLNEDLDVNDEPLVTVEFNALAEFVEASTIGKVEEPLQSHSSGRAESTHVHSQIDLEVDSKAVSMSATLHAETELFPQAEESPCFIIDVNPAPPSAVTAPMIAVDRMLGEFPLGSDGQEQEEIIVYVAPHPRLGQIASGSRASPRTPPSPQPTPLATLPAPSIQVVSASINQPSTPATPPAPSIQVSASMNQPSTPATPPVPSIQVSASMNQTSTPATPPVPSIQVSASMNQTSTPAMPPVPSIQVSASINQPSTPTPPSFDSLSISFESIDASASRNRNLRQHVASPRSRRLTKKSRRMAGRKMEREAMFGSFGAMMEEMHLQDDVRSKSRDPKRNEQRRGDSDIDWGDSSEGNAAAQPVGEAMDEISSGLGAMDIDSEVDQEAFENFARGVLSGGVHISIDDLADAEKMRFEDDGDGESSSEGTSSDDEAEEETIFKAEEGLLISENDEVGVSLGSESGDENGGSEEEDDISSDEEDTPKRSFQARLTKVRQNGKGKGKQAARTSSDDDDSSSDDFQFSRGFTWAEKDEAFIAELQVFLGENSEILDGRTRKQKETASRAIATGDSEELQGLQPAKRKKDKSVPPELQEQWEKDRAKKAENKRKRAQDRREAAADPFVPHKGGKKGRKAMLKARARARDIDNDDDDDDDDDESRPKRAFDAAALVAQLRTFVSNIGTQATMALPPMDKDARKLVHQLALAFSLKSLSKGKGQGRYTSLIKTTRTGQKIDERKVTSILKCGGSYFGGGGKGRTGAMPKPRDGDEVGKAAPKIGETNVGFKMLAAMGWSEGDRIGVSGGLDAPLTAIFKYTKLGLGATR